MPDESDFDHLRKDLDRALVALNEKDTELVEANAAIRDLASQFSQEKERAESAVADFKELEAALHKMFYLDDEPGDVDCLLEGLETHAKRYDDLVETSSKLIEAIDTACGWGGGSSFETAIQGVAMLREARKVADDRDGMRLRLEHAEGQASKLGHERDELAGAIDGAWRLAFAGLEWPHSDEENECVVAVRTIAEELVAAREELSKESAFRLETKAHAQSLEDLLSRKDQEISGLEARIKGALEGREDQARLVDRFRGELVKIREKSADQLRIASAEIEGLVAKLQQVAAEEAMGPMERNKLRGRIEELECDADTYEQRIDALEKERDTYRERAEYWQKINSGDYEASRLSSIIVDQAEQIMVLRKGVDDATS